MVDSFQHSKRLILSAFVLHHRKGTTRMSDLDTRSVNIHDLQPRQMYFTVCVTEGNTLYMASPFRLLKKFRVGNVGDAPGSILSEKVTGFPQSIFSPRSSAEDMGLLHGTAYKMKHHGRHSRTFRYTTESHLFFTGLVKDQDMELYLQLIRKVETPRSEPLLERRAQPRSPGGHGAHRNSAMAYFANQNPTAE